MHCAPWIASQRVDRFQFDRHFILDQQIGGIPTTTASS
jgi:hypothetical protein